MVEIDGFTQTVLWAVGFWGIAFGLYTLFVWLAVRRDERKRTK